ncbi:hypothetical protein NEIELOOT_03087 [Neisseria elongata subsp. glycolytica ATCC 29315]|uniref:Transposase n=1 Tax=Neisseria elongata subsp. glycolytica ATCC 29315 TaxID=546263 RepID=D4DVH0_NEIEG|nr:hypothetical protein NEIELOOT_03087 [Neisseria elongata subsp. glycolytica ATCC 29315]
MIRKHIQRPSEKKNRRIETALKFKFRGCPGYLGQPSFIFRQSVCF